MSARSPVEPIIGLRGRNPNPPPQRPRGYGALTVEQMVSAIGMLRAGLSQSAVGAHFGVTKNTIAGIWRCRGNGEARGPEPTTMSDRLDALHARMDAVLAVTLGVGRVPEPPREKRNSLASKARQAKPRGEAPLFDEAAQ